MKKEIVLKRIDELCKERNWSRNELAASANLSSGMIYQWFNSDRMPSYKSIEMLCDTLDISLCEFFAESKADKISVKVSKLLKMIEKLSENEIDTIMHLAETFLKNKETRCE